MRQGYAWYWTCACGFKMTLISDKEDEHDYCEPQMRGHVRHHHQPCLKDASFEKKKCIFKEHNDLSSIILVGEW